MRQPVKAREEAVGADGLASEPWWSRKDRKKKALGKKRQKYCSSA